MALPKGMGIEVEKPVRVNLINPATNLPLIVTATKAAAWIELYSSDSPIAKRRERQITLTRIAEAQARNNRPKQVNEGDLIRGEAEALDTLAALTHDWSLATLDGEAITDFPCTPENARELYQAPELTWLRDFVNTEAANRANFVKDSSINLSNMPVTSSGSAHPASPE